MKQLTLNVIENLVDPSVESTFENQPQWFPFYKRYDALREFTRIFGTRELPLDMLLCFALRVVIIDILKFEEQLKVTHPDFDWDHDSLQNAVLKYYGEEGLRLIHRMMLVDVEQFDDIVS
jgi:hypothetical protein